MIELIHGDCMDYMKDLSDNAFDLAIVDPPYGLNMDKNAFKNGINCKIHGFKMHKNGKWDKKIPSKEYFNKLFSISKNQIIFGANYFTQYLPPTMAWVFWYKMQDNFSFSDGEFIFTSFQTKARIFKYARGNDSGFSPKGESSPNIHPTQKPVQLYKWLLKKYATPDMKIIDTHLGSGSSAIAAYDFGCSFVGIEIDKEYYDAAVNRFNEYKRQLKIEFA